MIRQIIEGVPKVIKSYTLFPTRALLLSTAKTLKLFWLLCETHGIKISVSDMAGESCIIEILTVRNSTLRFLFDKGIIDAHLNVSEITIQSDLQLSTLQDIHLITTILILELISHVVTIDVRRGQFQT